MKMRTLLAAMGLAMQWMPVVASEPAKLPDLRVEYRGWTIGKDGARQELSYAERLYRRDGQLWVEREIPEAAQRQHDGHQHSGLGHKHDDVAGAPLWLKRTPEGALTVLLVDRHERRLIEVGPANYANVGFSGDWATTYYLLDPAELPLLKAVGKPRDGVQQYEARRGPQVIRMAWDMSGKFAREITANDERGLSGRSIRASRIPAPPSLPWDSTSMYRLGDYSDLLD